MKRYEFVGGDGPGAYPQEEPNGRMVAYADYKAEVDTLRELLREAAVSLTNRRDYDTAAKIQKALEI